MKKSPLSLALSGALLFAMASCSDDNEFVSVNDGSVTFNISVPGAVMSRANFGDGTTAQNNVKYYVYDQANSTTATPVLTGDVTMSGLKGSVTLNLAKAHTYDIVFLATSSTSPYTYDQTTRVLNMNYSATTLNSDENLDAFFKVVPSLSVDNSASTDVALTRPFAQLNIGTSDLAAYQAVVSPVTTTAVTVSDIYSSIDLMSGNVTGDPTEVTFAAAALPAGQTFPVTTTPAGATAPVTYTYLAMDYLLVNDTKDIVTVTMDVNTESGATEQKEYQNIPVQRNYRTNIYGALLTSEQTFNVEILPGFTGDNNVTPTPTEPAKDSNGVYLMKTQGDLAWLANQVNGGNNMSTSTFSLQNDIYMTGNWTPIGGGGNAFSVRFSGKFLGNGYTIYNMKVNASERAGFFGFLNGTVEDLNFDKAHVTSNHWAGVVVGYSDNETGSTYIKNCNVSNSTVTLAAELAGEKWDNGDKGGLIIGFMATNDQVENCTVTDCLLQGYRDLGGIIGYSAGAVIRNNTVNGLTIYVDNEHNYKNYPTLSSNDANAVIGENDGGVDEGNTSSNVSISGLVADGVTMDADGNYTISAPAGLVWMTNEVNSGATTFAGKTIKLGGNIDMKGVAYTPCGNVNAYPSITFKGVFDGCGYTISNLTASVTGDSGNASAGLFGSTTGKIQNVTLTDVNISSTHYAGAICGYSSSNVGMAITNCHVNGGTIVSAAELDGTKWDNGDKVGGIIGYAVAGDLVQDCSVENVTVQGYRDLGGIIGYSNGATVSNNTVTKVQVLVDNSHNYKSYATIGKGGNDAGEIIGEQNGGTNDGNTATGVVIGYVATSQEALNSAIKAITSGDNDIYLTAGTYTIPAAKNADAVINIFGASKAVIINAAAVQNAVKAINFNNVTISGGTGGTKYVGFQHVAESTSFTDCTINGVIFGYSPNLVFNNCDLNVNEDAYAIWTYASTKADFTDCQFTNTAVAKAILVYNETASYSGIDVTITNCTFSAPATTTKTKGVVEIHTELFTGPKGTISINKSSYTGPFLGWVKELNNNTEVPTNYWNIEINN